MECLLIKKPFFFVAMEGTVLVLHRFLGSQRFALERKASLNFNGLSLGGTESPYTYNLILYMYVEVIKFLDLNGVT